MSRPLTNMCKAIVCVLAACGAMSTISCIPADDPRQQTPPVLYRGHRSFPNPSADDAMTGAILAGRYLARVTSPRGRFVYIYRPRTDDAARGYNILRHAGTIMAMIELHRVSPDPDLLAAAERAIGYLLRTIRPCPTDPNAAWVVERGAVKLGGNALAILALVEHARATGKQTHLPIMRKLARWLVSVQQPDGRFGVHKAFVPSGVPTPFRSVYYPGEAILALLRLNHIDPNRTWVDTAERNARYLITVRDKKLTDNELPPDHWLLYGLNELYRIRKKPLYLEHARRIALAICRSQIRTHQQRDLIGGYPPLPPRATSTATRTEGLIAAWLLLSEFGDARDAAVIKQSVRLGIRFLLEMQFHEESAAHMPVPSRCLGGFPTSYDNPNIRIDGAQHAISALLAWRRIERFAMTNAK